MFSALSYALNMLTAHEIGNRAAMPVILSTGFFFHTFGNSLLSFITFSFYDSHHNYSGFDLGAQDTIKCLAGITSCVIAGSISQFSEIKAATLNRPSATMPFSYISVIVGMLVDVLVFSSEYNGLMVLGALMTSMGLFSKLIIEKFQ